MRRKTKIEDRFDFRAFGQAIKEARLKRGLTREQAAALIPLDSRYLTNIENKGQHPSLDKLHRIVTLFDLSVDEFFYPGIEPSESSRRRQLDTLIDSLNDRDLIILEATANGILQSKN